LKVTTFVLEVTTFVLEVITSMTEAKASVLVALASGAKTLKTVPAALHLPAYRIRQFAVSSPCDKLLVSSRASVDDTPDL